jgi:hypothetical protein
VGRLGYNGIVKDGFMNATQAHEFQAVWGQIKDWPDELQVSLALKILSSFQHASMAPRKPLADLMGMLSTDESLPTDEDVQRILEEERTRRFG